MKNFTTASLEAFTPLQVVAAVQAAKSAAGAVAQVKTLNTDNLITATRDTRVEPIALIDGSIINESQISDILAIATKMFTGYYLRAIEMTVTLDGVSVSERLAKFNPNRSVINAVVSTASYEDPAQYPTLGTTYKVSTEGKSDPKEPSGADVSGTLKQMDNLALGMSVNVNFRDGDSSYKMPVNIRLIPVNCAPKLITSTFEIGSVRNSFKERWHRFKAGELSLIGDLVLCNDLVDAHRRAEIKDKSGFYKETMRRRRNNTIAGLISGQPSVANSSNIMIISKRTALQIENQLEGQLSDFKTRERAFEHTSVMIMIIVDTDWERVSIYSRSIELGTDLQYRDFKSINSKGGTDVEDILRMYQEAAKPGARSGVLN